MASFERRPSPSRIKLIPSLKWCASKHVMRPPWYVPHGGWPLTSGKFCLSPRRPFEFLKAVFKSFPFTVASFSLTSSRFADTDQDGDDGSRVLPSRGEPTGRHPGRSSLPCGHPHAVAYARLHRGQRKFYYHGRSLMLVQGPAVLPCLPREDANLMGPLWEQHLPFTRPITPSHVEQLVLGDVITFRLGFTYIRAGAVFFQRICCCS